MPLETQAMTIEQEQHLQRIKSAFMEAVDAKYRKGAREHGGNLWENSALALIEFAMEECVDQWTYLHDAREKLINATRQTTTLADCPVGHC